MKKIILILTMCAMLTACNVQATETEMPKSEAVQITAAETKSVTTTTAATAATTTVTTTTTATTTTKKTETTVSAEKKKAATTAVKKEEEKTAPAVYEETEEYEVTETQPRKKEAEPPKQDTPSPPTEPSTEVPKSSGISQSEINGYIIQSAANCGMAGASVVDGGMWDGGYSFNSPINTAINNSVYDVQNCVDSELCRIYSECENGGMTPEEISQYLYIYVCWDGEWLYIMW